METYVVRVWLPDRPGALGAVASRIGAVRGDVVGIDILETGDGVAVDELVVRLPQGSLVELLVSEIQEVDGVTVEDVKAAGANGRDPRLDALETAAMICGADTMDELLRALVVHGGRTLGAEWSAVVDLASGEVRATSGGAPTEAWLSAFVHGARAAGGDDQHVGGADVAWAPLPGVDLALVAGRTGTPFRAKERRQVAALARVAGTRAREVGRARSRRAHPSAPPDPLIPMTPSPEEEDDPMRTYSASDAIVKAGLAKPTKAPPSSPRGSRRGRWSPPAPQG